MPLPITTQRLIIRAWKESDILPFAKMNQDSEVMQFFPKTLSESDSLDLVKRMQLHQAERGFCYWAAEEMQTQEFIGFIGLKYQDYESPYTPCIDIGWRLKRSSWGKGYATEGALACLEYGFNELNLKEIYSFCPAVNIGSERVMQKIGMSSVGNFDHSLLDDQSELKNCLAYKIKKNTV